MLRSKLSPARGGARHQLLAGEDAAGFGREGGDEIHLHRGKRDRRPLRVAQAEGGEVEDVAPEARPPPRRRRSATEDRRDAHDELARIERLGEIVVRPDLEPDDAVDGRCRAGQHVDARVGADAELAGDVEPVAAW